jgi:hypothetical protein
MKRCLICAGLVAAVIAADFGHALSPAGAQVVAPPGNPNVPVNPHALTPQQRQRIRQMMRRRRHHRHRHKTPVTPAVPATSLIPGAGLPPAMTPSPMLLGTMPRRHRGHHHRHHRYQWVMAQMMMRQMMLNQLVMQAQAIPGQMPASAVPQRPPTNPNRTLTAQRRRQIAAQVHRASF